MMECWKDGRLGNEVETVHGLILSSPTFQYSIVPVFLTEE